MKYFFLSFSLLLTLIASAQYSWLEDARTLAEKWIIVNQSSAASQSADYAGGSTLAQEPQLYRLNDFIIRQEVLGIALKLRGISLPATYACRGYFSDAGIAGEWWVCRAAELSADADIITRANTSFRPRATLTLAEALGIVIKSLNISLSTTPTTTIAGNLPAWQKRLILTIQEKQIPLDVRDSSGRGIVMYDARLGATLSWFDMSHEMTRGEFFQLVVALLDYQSSVDPLAHCSVYNDGCNDCVVWDEGISCTKRACLWKGIPSCSYCETGYTLENNRCVKKQTSCVAEWGYAGGGFVMYPENIDDFQCCSGFTRAERKDGSTLADAGYTCINEGDFVCDSRYESEYNSNDCRLVMGGFDPSICQSYYDGCNSCSNTSDGQTVCTMRYCFTSGPAYCTNYKPYTPINQSQDNTYLGQVLKEIQNYTKDLSCTSTDQCQWKLFGNTACGGSSIGIKYSKKNIDESLFQSKTNYYTNAQMLYNTTYPVFSPCMMMTSPPPLTCINSLCQ